MMKNINRKIIAITLAITSVTTTVMMPASAAWSSTPFTFTTGTYTYTYQGTTNGGSTSNSENEWYPEVLYGSYDEYKTRMDAAKNQSIPTISSYGTYYKTFTKKPYEYNSLTKSEQNLYNNIMKYVNDGKSEIKIAENVSTKTLKNVINVISEYGCGASFEYYEASHKLSVYYYKPDDDFVKIAKKIAKTLPEDATEYDTVKAIHDFMCKNYTYGSSEYKNIEHYYKSDSLICGGYAIVFQQFCKYFNLDCIKIFTDIHAWNKVNIDGSWYNVDVCWDDRAKIYYTYFLISDARLKKVDKENNHKLDNTTGIPKSTKSYSK